MGQGSRSSGLFGGEGVNESSPLRQGFGAPRGVEESTSQEVKRVCLANVIFQMEEGNQRSPQLNTLIGTPVKCAYG